jgi:hypothetical protein
VIYQIRRSSRSSDKRMELLFKAMLAVIVAGLLMYVVVRSWLS